MRTREQTLGGKGLRFPLAADSRLFLRMFSALLRRYRFVFLEMQRRRTQPSSSYHVRKLASSQTLRAALFSLLSAASYGS